MKEPTKIDLAKNVTHTTFLGGLTAFSGWQLYRLARTAAPPPLKVGMYAAEFIHIGWETVKAANYTKDNIQYWVNAD